MATSEENDLIGYDPLAWMEGQANKNEDQLLTDEIESENEIRLISDYPVDLIEDAEETENLSDLTDAVSQSCPSDEPNITEDESDSAVIEEMANYAEDTELESDDAVAVNSDPEELAGSQIDLDPTLTIQNVVKLHEKLKNSLAIHDQIEINASDVVSIDTSTLQLLVSLKKDAEKLQKQVSIIYPSPRFIESVQLLGLLEVLDIKDA